MLMLPFLLVMRTGCREALIGSTLQIYFYTLHLDSSLYGLDLESRSQGCKKLKNFVPIVSQSWEWIWIEFGMLLRLVGLVNLVLILAGPISFQWRESNDFVQKKNTNKKKKNPPKTQTSKQNKKHFNVGMHSYIYRLISLKLGMLMNTTKLYTLIPVEWVWPSFKIAVIWDSRSICTRLLTSFSVGVDEI